LSGRVITEEAVCQDLEEQERRAEEARQRKAELERQEARSPLIRGILEGYGYTPKGKRIACKAMKEFLQKKNYREPIRSSQKTKFDRDLH